MTGQTSSTGVPLAALRPIAPSPRTESPSLPSEPSTEPPRLSSLGTIQPASRRVLDFDVETVAAGFADPEWVPQTVTAWAACWISPDVTDSCDVLSAVLPVAAFYDVAARREFLTPLVNLIAEADVVTGHNIVRFDLPVVNAEAMRVGAPKLGPVLAQDTIRVGRVKGFKKGQDVMANLLGVRSEKLPLNWAEWAAAYAEDGMGTVRDRVEGDVRQHMELRDRMRGRGWLEAPRMWRP